jgi:hypothetical protein
MSFLINTNFAILFIDNQTNSFIYLLKKYFYDILKFLIKILMIS